MQASTNVRQTPPGRRAGRGSRVLLAVLAMLLLSLYALLEGGKTAKAIVGGTEVKDNATYPFMAQVWWTYPASDGKTTYTTLGCTGTLLDNNSVLTAAHCVTGLKPNTTISVVVGPRTANDTFHEGKNLSVAPQGQKFSVDTPLHICCETSDPKSSENYNVGDHLQPFDAAVINLSQPVTLPNVKPINVKPIQLAKPSDGDNLEKKNAPATAAGWG
jgi:Trypsin